MIFIFFDKLSKPTSQRIGSLGSQSQAIPQTKKKEGQNILPQEIASFNPQTPTPYRNKPSQLKPLLIFPDATSCQTVNYDFSDMMSPVEI